MQCTAHLASEKACSRSCFTLRMPGNSRQLPKFLEGIDWSEAVGV
jgi:hypothetical protein